MSVALRTGLALLKLGNHLEDGGAGCCFNEAAGEWRQWEFIHSDLAADFKVCNFAVIAGVEVRIQRSALERFDNRLFFDGDSSFGESVHGFVRQPARQKDSFHVHLLLPIHRFHRFRRIAIPRRHACR